MEPAMPRTTATRNGPDPIDVATGARVRARRCALGMSQQTLGEAIGLTFQQVQKYERGSNRISVSTLTRIAKALECSAASLIGEAEAPPPVSSVYIGRMFKMLDSLPAKDRGTVFSIAEALSKTEA
jgi:transcriptional regulator with XRE-family HTH domain